MSKTHHAEQEGAKEKEATGGHTEAIPATDVAEAPTKVEPAQVPGPPDDNLVNSEDQSTAPMSIEEQLSASREAQKVALDEKEALQETHNKLREDYDKLGEEYTEALNKLNVPKEGEGEGEVDQMKLEKEYRALVAIHHPLYRDQIVALDAAGLKPL